MVNGVPTCSARRARRRGRDGFGNRSVAAVDRNHAPLPSQKESKASASVSTVVAMLRCVVRAVTMAATAVAAAHRSRGRRALLLQGTKGGDSKRGPTTDTAGEP